MFQYAYCKCGEVHEIEIVPLPDRDFGEAVYHQQFCHNASLRGPKGERYYYIKDFEYLRFGAESAERIGWAIIRIKDTAHRVLPNAQHEPMPIPCPF